MRRFLSLGVLCVALLARAQDVAPMAPPPVAVPAPPPIVSAEDDRTITYTDDDRILYGAERKELTPLELFGALGRTDLLEQSKVNAHRRTALLISAIAVAVVGVGIGIAVLATGPHLETGRCNFDTVYYNDVCVPANLAHQVGGIGSLGAGLVIGGVLATLAWWSRPEVFTRYELQKFIEGHNAGLAASKPISFKIEVAPSVGPTFAGLVAKGTF